MFLDGWSFHFLQQIKQNFTALTAYVPANALFRQNNTNIFLLLTQNVQF